MTTNDELKFKLHTEPLLFTVFNKVQSDVGVFNVSPEEMLRAAHAWVVQKLNEYDTPPEWLWQELARAEQQREASNTIEGESPGS